MKLIRIIKIHKVCEIARATDNTILSLKSFNKNINNKLKAQLLIISGIKFPTIQSIKPLLICILILIIKNIYVKLIID